jgi:hypothetical protein
MRYRAAFLCFMFICFVVSASGQQVERQQKRRFVVVPPEQALVTVAFQPECPLQFEEAKLLAFVEGGGAATYVIRNKGTKPIRSFTVGVPGLKLTWSEELTKRLFMPGERIVGGGDDEIEMVPLTDELRDKLKLKGPMRGVAVFMVIRVEYADGTVYSAEPAYKALRKFSDELDDLRANAKP